MKKFIPFVLMISTATMQTSCLPGKQIVKSVIDIGLAICISQHTEIQDEKALREVCRWTDELAPAVKELLSAREAGIKAASKAGACK